MSEWIVSDEDLGCDGAYFSYTEVVRCKDCKHTVSFTCGRVDCRYCVVNDRDVDENDFCSYGEKGEGEWMT